MKAITNRPGRVGGAIGPLLVLALAYPSQSCVSGGSFPIRAELAPVERPGQEVAGGQEPGAVEASGLVLDAELGVASIPVSVLVRDDLLEYLLVGPSGAGHESLFLTEVQPSLLNAGLLALGCSQGENARWEPGASDAEEPRIVLPEGDPLFLYVAWSEEDEVYFFRVEDLLSNLRSGRSMRRHGWVFLGSRFHSPGEGEPESFVADLEGNHVNLAFFFQRNTLVTAALPECQDQTIWIANPWLLPPRGTSLLLLFSRERLEGLPAAWNARIPRVTAPDARGTVPDDR